MTAFNFFLRRNKVIEFFKSRSDFSTLIVQNPTDIYYLTGFLVSRGHLVLSKTKSCFFIDGRYLAACKKSEQLDVQEFSKENLTAFFRENNSTKIFFDKSYTTYQSYERLLELKMDLMDLVGIESLIEPLRAVKDTDEIALLKKSQALLDSGFAVARNSLKEGITEKEIAWVFEKFVKEHGGDSLSFDAIVAFGKNSAYPHHITGSTQLKKGDIVLLDMGVTCNHYRSDMSRTFLFDAELSSNPKFQKIFDSTKKCQQLVMEKAKIGMTGKMLEEIAREELRKINHEKYFNHSLGHGIGLDIHELPKISKISDDRILENMVFTIEPGIYLEGFGGVRIEDSVVMTKNGVCTLSEYLP